MISQASRRWANQLNDLRERWIVRRRLLHTGQERVPVDQFAQVVRGLEKDELLSIKAELEEILNDIKFQLDAARSRKQATGKYADFLWYRDAERSKRSVGNHIQVILNELSRQNRIRRAAMKDHFMDVVREELGDDEFDELLNKARARVPTR